MATGRIVFNNMPAARMWALVSQFAKAKGLRMLTDKHQQNALSLYLKTASFNN